MTASDFLDLATTHRLMWGLGRWLTLVAVWLFVCEWAIRRGKGSSALRLPFLVTSGIYIMAAPLLLGSSGHAAFAAVLGLFAWAPLSKRALHALPRISSFTELNRHALHRRELVLADASPAAPTTPRRFGIQIHKRAVHKALDILDRALRVRATVVRLEPLADGTTRLTYEIDGVKRTAAILNVKRGTLLLRGLKTVGNMNPADRNPQTSRFELRFRDRPVHLSASTMKIPFGQACEVRLDDGDLAEGRYRHGLAAVGINPPVGDAIRAVVRGNRGMVLLCGPQGSGRTTTTYAAVHEIDPFQNHVFIIEDKPGPELPPATQYRVDPANRRTASRMLAEIVSPTDSVIVLDEVHDADLAQAALHAAANKPVIAVTRAEDAADALVSLLRLGVPAALIRSRVTTVVAQRLVRPLCRTCRRAYPPPIEFLRKLDAQEGIGTIFRSGRRGCEACAGTGYRGRLPVLEVLPIDDAIGIALEKRLSRKRVRAIARASGMVTLRQHSLQLVRDGFTSIREIVRQIP